MEVEYCLYFILIENMTIYNSKHISFIPIILTFICIFLLSIFQTMNFESYIIAFISRTNQNAALIRQTLVTFRL